MKDKVTQYMTDMALEAEILNSVNADSTVNFDS